MWWTFIILAQANQPGDPLQSLLNSSNPVLVIVGTVLTVLFGADKVAFWMTRYKARAAGISCHGADIKKSVEALADTQTELAHTARDVSKTLDRLDEYCQRHFEQTSLELRSVREELRAIRERMRSPDGSSRP